MKLRPLHDKVLVKRTEEEETSSGGIILSGSAKEKPSQGEVISVGPGKKNDSGDVVPIPNRPELSIILVKYVFAASLVIKRIFEPAPFDMFETISV